jgi:hypothetical protein
MFSKIQIFNPSNLFSIVMIVENQSITDVWGRAEDCFINTSLVTIINTYMLSLLHVTCRYHHHQQVVFWLFILCMAKMCVFVCLCEDEIRMKFSEH